MNAYSHNNNTAGIIRHSCGIIFILFSFLYLYFLQGELISKAQYVLSNGTTTYSIFWGALIITAVLRLIQIPISKYIKVPVRYHALSYLPSMTLLTALCDVASATTKGESSGGWWLGLIVLFFLFYLLVRFAVYIDSALYTNPKWSNKLSPYLTSNSIAFLLIIFCCGTCNSSTDVDMYEQKVERLVLNNDYEDAIRVGEKSLNANLRLTNLRMYALSEQGLLADRLFDYPQYYGSEGLLCVSDTGRHLYRFDARDICQYLGVPCDSNIHTTTDYFNSVVFRQQLVADSLMGIELARSNNPDSLQGQIDMHYEKLKTDKRRIDDYILCGLLLDRNIDGFKEKLDELYSKEYFSDSVVPVDSLPRAYREAMVMIYPEIGDTMMLEQYATYLDLKESEKDSTVSSNITRRKKIGENSPRTFGNTYWWYYYNPKITRKRSK